MILRYLDSDAYILKKINVSLLIKLPSFKDLWLFQCSEGTQFNLLNQRFKINHLSKIVVPNLHISSISGLLGLLSTLNLMGRTKSLHVYAPPGLKYYLDFGKKYSKTNFNYILYIHILNTGLIINHCKCRIYAAKVCGNYNIIIAQSEYYGTFDLSKARCNYLAPGPLYGKLKQGGSFLFPDGYILEGDNFTSSSFLGFQVSYLFSSFYKKYLIQTTKKSRIILFM